MGSMSNSELRRPSSQVSSTDAEANSCLPSHQSRNSVGEITLYRFLRNRICSRKESALTRLPSRVGSTTLSRRQNTVISKHRRSGLSCAEIAALRQAWIDNVLQQWTDEFHTFISTALF